MPSFKSLISRTSLFNIGEGRLSRGSREGFSSSDTMSVSVISPMPSFSASALGSAIFLRRLGAAFSFTLTGWGFVCAKDALPRSPAAFKASAIGPVATGRLANTSDLFCDSFGPAFSAVAIVFSACSCFVSAFSFPLSLREMPSSSINIFAAV